MKRSGRLGQLGASLLTAAGPLAAYLATRAPTISWANGGADGGDLAAAVASRGIAHPPGYPTYTLVGIVWSALPTDGDLAGRLVLLSVISGAVAAVLLGATVTDLARRTGAPAWCSVASGVVAGAAWGWTPTAWSQAVIVEVYAHGMVWLGLALLLLARLCRDSHARAYLLAGMTIVLGFGALPQIVVLVPCALALVPQWLSGPGRVTRAVATVGSGLLGLTVFAYLPIRAADNPPFIWGDPTSPAGLAAIMTAEIYRDLPASIDATTRLYRAVESVVIISTELGILVPFAIFGIGVLARRQRDLGGLLFALLALTVAFRASYPAEGNIVYLLPATYAACVLAGIGLADAAGAFAKHHRLGGALLLLVVGAIALWRVPLTLDAVDASRDRRAEQFAQLVLTTVPPGSLVVSDRDETTFALWYHQGLGERTDLVVVDARLLTHDWYRANLARQHPDLDPRAIRPGGLTAIPRPLYIVRFDPAGGTPTLDLIPR